MQQNQSFRNPFISYLLMYILNRFGLDLVVHQDSKGVIHPAVLHNKLRHSRRRHETLHEESSRLGYFLFPGSVLDGDKELMPLDSLPMRMYDATRIWNDVAPMLTSLGGILRFVQGLFGAVRRFQLQQYFEERLAATCLFVCEAGYEENGLAVRTDNLALSIHQSDKPLRTRGVQFQGSTEELQPHNLVAFWQPAYVLTKAGISMGAFDTAVEALRSVWDKPNVIRTAALRGEIFINADF